MWDQVDPETGHQREAALKQDPVLWGSMIKHGSKVLRHDNGLTSGLDILTYLISQRSPMTLDIQRELVDQKMQLKDTKAGKEVLTEVEQQRQEYQQKVQELEAKVQRLEEACERGNKSWRNTVEEFEELKERKELAEQKLARTHEDTLKLQATHDQIMAEQKRHYEQLLQQQQGKQSLNLDQVGEEERKKFRENYRREMRRMCILM
jgi:chromosome segregation ATPase